MSDLIFDQGVEYWLGRYFNTPNTCIPSLDIANSFGMFLEQEFNKPSTRNELCSEISKNVVEKFDGFGSKTRLNRKGSCFVDEKIEYKANQRYINFPDFKSKGLKGFVIRININPCMLKQNSMTKIYCNARYLSEINGENSIEYNKRAQDLCSTTVDYVSRIYETIFRNFILHEMDTSLQASMQPNLGPYYDTISTFAGSKDEKINALINYFSDICSGRNYDYNPEHVFEVFKSFSKLAQKMNKAVFGQKNSSLKKYSWEVFDITEKSIVTNTIEKFKALSGFKDCGNYYHYLGLVNSIPRNFLLPMNIELINSN
jgi:hypothetical protein